VNSRNDFSHDDSIRNIVLVIIIIIMIMIISIANKDYYYHQGPLMRWMH